VQSDQTLESREGLQTIHGWMDGYMDGYMDEWMDGWMDPWSQLMHKY
jgi:hypothetical protein